MANFPASLKRPPPNRFACLLLGKPVVSPEPTHVDNFRGLEEDLSALYVNVAGDTHQGYKHTVVVRAIALRSMATPH